MAITRSGPVTRDGKTVALGLAKVMVGDSAGNISDPLLALNEITESLGALNASSFTSNVEYWKLESGFPMLEDKTIPLRESVSLACEFKEVHPKNVAIARGIDPAGSIASSAHVLDVASALGELSQGTGDLVTVDADTPTAKLTLVFTGTEAFNVFKEGDEGVMDTGDFSAADVIIQDGATTILTIKKTALDSGGAFAISDVITIQLLAQGTYTDNQVGSIALGNISAPDYVRVEAKYMYPDNEHFMAIILPRVNITSSLELPFAMEDNSNVPITCEAKRADSGVAGITDTTWDSMPLGRIYWAMA